MNEEQKLSDVLSANYMLADITVPIWSGVVTDRAATIEVTHAKGAVDNAAKVMKYVLAGVDGDFKAAQSAFRGLRTWFYANTSPWTSTDYGAQRGSRIIPTTQAIAFLGEFATRKAAAKAALQPLIDDWDATVIKAASTTGGLYDVTLYPDATELDRLFDAELQVAPLPTVANFEGLSIPANLAEGLAAKYEQHADARVDNVLRDMQRRILKELKRMAEQFGKIAAEEKTRVFKSLVGNMEHLVSMAKDLNINNSDEMDDLIRDIENRLLQHDVDKYKATPSLAAAAAKAAQEISAKASDIGVFTGREVDDAVALAQIVDVPSSGALVNMAAKAIDDEHARQEAMHEPVTEEKVDEIVEEKPDPIPDFDLDSVFM